jgi:hypothetical protein
MAIAPVNKFLNIAVPVAPGVQKLYEVPTGTTSLLLYAQVSNVGVGTYPKVTFWQRRESRSTGNTRDVRIIKEVEIPPNDAVILVDGRMVLEKTPLVVDSVYVKGHQERVGIITGVDYDEPTGIATVMCNDTHRLNAGEPITMGGIYFTCGKFYTPGNSTTYDPTTGLLVLDIGAHSLLVGETIKIKDNAMKFTCLQDGGATQHEYPRSTDPVSGNNLSITAVTATTITVQVLSTVPSTNTTAHTFVPDSGVANSISDNAYTGITTNIFPDPQQGYEVDSIIDQVGTSKTFTTYLGSASGNVHNYEPAVHTFVRGQLNAVELVNTTSSNHTSQSLLSPTTGTSYNPNDGLLTVTTTGAHGLTTNDVVKIADESLTFECDKDSRATQHLYPRSTDPISNKWIPVTVVSANTFTVKVLDVVPSIGDTSTHYYMDGSANSITKSGSRFNVYGSTYDPKSGEVVLKIGANDLQNGDTIRIADNSLTYTCTMDLNNSEHTYPRVTDPASGSILTIAVAVTNESIRVNVGKSYSGGFVAPLQMELSASILENSNV